METTFNPQALAELIQRKRLTQTEVACRLGVATQQLQAWATGKHEPRASTLAKLAEVLGVKVGDFFTTR